MKILFICLSTLEFNVLTPYSEPLGGTESALSYLSVELAKLGHDVYLMARTQDAVIEGVKHIPISEDLQSIDPDVIVAVSCPQACPSIKKIAPRAKIILWNHMMPNQPALLPLFQPETAQTIDHIVYVSERQRGEFAAVAQKTVVLDGDRTTVINNAVAPCFENLFTGPNEILAVKECRGAYTSTPYRGLAILSVIKELPIEVYSSMKVYQGNDDDFAAVYSSLKTNDCLELFGSVSQKDLKDKLRRIAFLVYPSIFTECHSIAILEAMASGLKVITTDFACAPTEFIDSMPSATGSVEEYAALLRKNINNFRAHPEEWAEKIWQQVQYVNRECTWAKRAWEWNNYLHECLK
jgi:hypothetical protein